MGSALKDIMFYCEEISALRNTKNVTCSKLLAVEYGAKIPIKEVFINYGGGAMNTAVGMKNFGIEVAPLVRVGQDQVGKELYSYLKRQKISTALMQVDKEKPTGFSIVMTAAKDKEHTIFTYKGASDNLEIVNIRDFRTKWFYVSSLTNKSWALEFEKIARQHKRDVLIAWNPGGLQLKNFKALISFLPAIEILILNKDEAIELVKNQFPVTPKAKLEDTKFLLKTIKKFGSHKVVITMGKKGAAGLDEFNRHYYLAARSVVQRIVDTVGAGDAFSSGLIAGMVRWNNFEKALQLGLRNSANVLYRIGAQNGLLKIKI